MGFLVHARILGYVTELRRTQVPHASGRNTVLTIPEISQTCHGFPAVLVLPQADTKIGNMGNFIISMEANPSFTSHIQCSRAFLCIGRVASVSDQANANEIHVPNNYDAAGASDTVSTLSAFVLPDVWFMPVGGDVPIEVIKAFVVPGGQWRHHLRSEQPVTPLTRSINTQEQDQNSIRSSHELCTLAQHGIPYSLPISLYVFAVSQDILASNTSQ
jgi:hypothetical protein